VLHSSHGYDPADPSTIKPTPVRYPPMKIDPQPRGRRVFGNAFMQGGTFSATSRGHRPSAARQSVPRLVSRRACGLQLSGVGGM